MAGRLAQRVAVPRYHVTVAQGAVDIPIEQNFQERKRENQRKES